MISFLRFALRVAIYACVLASSAELSGQQSEPIGEIVPFTLRVQPDLRSLPVSTSSPRLVDERVVRRAGRPWLQLEFSELVLERESLLEITSVADGATEVFDARSRGRRFSSYFNGDAVRLRLWATHRDAACRYTLHSIGVGARPQGATIATLCGADDRKPTVDRRVARLMLRFKNGFSWCSAFLISPTNDGRAWDCFATSGQCLALTGIDSMTAEFQVPNSQSDGTIVHPAPTDQYVVGSRRQFAAGRAGADWGLFATLPNATSGLHAGVVQKAGFRFSTATTVPSAISLLAHGTSTLVGSRNGVLQSGAGSVLKVAASVVSHRSDTTGGSAGGPILDGSGDVYAIQIEGGCDATSTSANAGTLASLAAFVKARQAFCVERADLDVTQVSAQSTTWTAGTSVDLQATIVNAGSIVNPAVRSAYYLSDDAVITASDQLLHSFQLAAINPQQSFAHRASARVPVGVRDGACWVGFFADDGAALTEWNENNNTKSVPVSCVSRPNFEIRSFTIREPALVAGATIQVDLVLANTGGRAAPASDARIVLSHDAVVTKSDRELTTFAVPAIAASGTFRIAGPIPVPRDIRNGKCWVGLFADVKDAVTEGREDDNASVVAKDCKGLPDLVVSNVVADRTLLRPDIPFVASVRADNIGAVPAVATTTSFVLSKDSVVSGDDTILGTVNLPGLWPGTFVTLRRSTKAPANLAAGPCWIGAAVDPTNLVVEQFETNNTVTSAVQCSSRQLRADLTSASFRSSTQAPIANQLVDFDVDVRNDGFVASTPCRAGFYLSADSVITTGDLFLTSAPIAAVAKSATLAIKASVRMPLTLATGKCWFGVILDDQSLVLEENEANNTASVEALCTAQADLMVRQLTASTTQWAARTSVTVTVDVANRGGSATPRTSLGVYLSADPIVGLRDRLLVASDFAALAATGTRTVRQQVVMPDDIASGECWLGVFLDRTNQVLEIDETNNTDAVLGRCTGEPDLVCSVLDVVDVKLVAGASVAIRTVVENRGGAVAPATRVAIVMTPGTQSTFESPLLAIVDVPVLLAGQRSDVTTRHVVPWFVVGPKSYVTAHVDPERLLVERNRGNNTTQIREDVTEATAKRRSLEWVPRFPDVTRKVCTLSLAKGRGADLELTMPGSEGFAYILLWSGNRTTFVFDAASSFNLGLLNGPAFPNWVGLLDAKGRAKALFRLPKVSNIIFDVAVHGLLLKQGLVFDGFAADVLQTAIRP